MTSRDTHLRCTFIPPWLAERVDGPERAAYDDELRLRRGAIARSALATAPGGAAWTVHDAASRTSLPGTPARRTGEPATGDVAVDEAADGIAATLAMFAEELGRNSHDDVGAPVSLTVHYGTDYNNAFWDGTQLVFGDGDGRIFERFTKPVDVLAHEFAHAVIEHTADLTYRGQSGALNESVADVFASCLKQRLLGQEAGEGDWLIGEGIFMPTVQARALRDMAAPGTAYDDPEVGADPQVAHMDDYVVTTADNGGVHLNSGIPNKAFQLAAIAVGGRAIEGAGRIWYAALAGGDVPPGADFATFAAATVAAAGEHADAVREAWAQVGVGPGASGVGTPPRAPAGRLRVERSGGFVGRTQVAEVDLDDPAEPDLPALVADALARPVAKASPTHPDMYLYTFTVAGHAPVSIPEHQLSPTQRELARRLLDGRHDA
ncbi:hypothetical protein GCM10009641_45830 [Mycobacterium cookii]|uniref:Neutral metalloproteinase n=1 Tax=Nocardioides furvisabuli TaxID=375542 RepID=A0ABP5JIR0_9ACTN|nr:protealysin inhibitor emfourin [Nocardioides furvisabuli]